MSDDLLCPSCGASIQVTQALMTQLSGQIRDEMKAQNESDKKKFELLVAEKEKEALRFKQLMEEQGKQQQENLDAEKKRIESSLVEKMHEQLLLQESELKKKIQEENELKQKDLANRLKENEEKQKKDQQMMLELMKQIREKDEKAQEMQIDMQHKLTEEVRQSFAKAQKMASDQYEMQIKERDKMNDDLRKKIEELQMKATESSVQIRGEIQELELEALLRELFPMDVIEPIGKGKFGADVAQKVRDQYGRTCGVILWESKHTKTWMADWLPKLREDLRAYKGHIAVLASQTMPDGVETFGLKDGIWVTNYDCLAGLATALRHQLIYIAYERNASSGKGEKMEMLYNYLIGHEFKQKIEAIVEVFSTMKEDLDKEKNGMERLWKKREMQLARLAVNTSRMYGEMQGLVGSALPDVRGLELEAGDDAPREARNLLDLMG
jgi:hypothetical protein